MMAKHFRLFLALSKGAGMVRSLFPEQAPPVDLVFVVPEYVRGWILEGIAKEIARYFPGTCRFHYSVRALPNAKAYFFVHYGTLAGAYKLNPVLWRRRVFVYYTHPRDDLGIDQRELLYLLNQIDRVFCMGSLFVAFLQSQGIDAGRAVYVLGGADPGVFLPRERGGGKVGFCTAFYARKSPDKILGIVKAMPHRNFLLIGRDWNRYERFSELVSLPNFEYVEAPYDEYPQLYRQMDVFVSVSRLEGGPIPLLEAMMCNVVPVASRTGFAPDIIQHGENGFLFDVNEGVPAICRLIDEAMALQANVRETAENYSWRNFAGQVSALMGFKTGPAPGTKQLIVV